MNKYAPPFSVTNRIIEYVAQISELVGCVNSTVGIDKNPVLRRKNRILTIQSSLGIEQNSLTVEQVTACLLRAAFSIMNLRSYTRLRMEMQEFCGIQGRKKFSENYLKPLLAQGKLKMTIPDKPNSKNQKYRANM